MCLRSPKGFVVVEPKIWREGLVVLEFTVLPQRFELFQEDGEGWTRLGSSLPALQHDFVDLIWTVRWLGRYASVLDVLSYLPIFQLVIWNLTQWKGFIEKNLKFEKINVFWNRDLPRKTKHQTWERIVRLLEFQGTSVSTKANSLRRRLPCRCCRRLWRTQSHPAWWSSCSTACWWGNSSRRYFDGRVCSSRDRLLLDWRQWLWTGDRVVKLRMSYSQLAHWIK